MNDSKPLIAIVGAGIAGLSCATLLTAAGLRVVLFDKSRGPGGRMATRRSSSADGFLTPGAFDHGAQYFTAKDPAFSTVVDQWQRLGIVSPWRARFATITPDGTVPEADSPVRYVATPTMSALGKHLAQPLGIKLTSTINHLSRSQDRWQISSTEAGQLKPPTDVSQGGFDHLLLAIPPTQALTLLGGIHPEFSRQISAVSVAPCWAAMLELPATPSASDFAFAAAFIKRPDSPLAFMAADHTKPGRISGPPNTPASAAHRWVLHASADWSQAHLEDSAEFVAGILAAEFARLAGVSLVGSACKAHRWRYAKTTTPLTRPLAQSCLYDAATCLGICGDWCLGNNVESAWLSGRSLAGEVLRSTN